MTLPFTIEDLLQEIENGYVSARSHPTEDLTIYNYTNHTQYDHRWNNVTRNCRGLILDNEYNIVARPFPKIFNYTEIVPEACVWTHPTITQDKVDGSLAICYNGNKIATRGSFTSEQAIWATDWMAKNYPNFQSPPGVTTLFEIIYPENRICVDYEDREELILLTAINNETGADISPEEITWWDGPAAEEILGVQDIEHAYRLATGKEYDNREGLVCTWFKYDEPSFRMKIKHPEYVRLHKIIYSFSELRVWESLYNGEDFLELLDSVPDEFYNQVKLIIEKLTNQYLEIEKDSLAKFNSIKDSKDRKNFANESIDWKYPSILFQMYDGKDYSHTIWKLIKPKGE